jgi:hypothetical protein
MVIVMQTSPINTIDESKLQRQFIRQSQVVTGDRLFRSLGMVYLAQVLIDIITFRVPLKRMRFCPLITRSWRRKWRKWHFENILFRGKIATYGIEHVQITGRLKA